MNNAEKEYQYALWKFHTYILANHGLDSDAVELFKDIFEKEKEVFFRKREYLAKNDGIIVGMFVMGLFALAYHIFF